MDLYAKVKADNKRILNNGLMVAGTLYNNRIPGSKTQPINVYFNDVSFSLNPETGLPVIGRKVSISIHIDDITVDKTDENYDGYGIKFVNNLGQEVKGVFINPMPDRVLGMLTASMRLQA